MKIELDIDGCLFINGESKYCMYDTKRYCSIKCAQFSTPSEYNGSIYIFICHNKDWNCKEEDFIDNRVKVSNA